MRVEDKESGCKEDIKYFPCYVKIITKEVCMIESVALVKEMYQSFAQGDLGKVKNCFSETVDFTMGGDLPYSGKYTSYSQVEELQPS